MNPYRFQARLVTYLQFIQWTLLIGVCLGSFSCSKVPEIHQYSVAKESRNENEGQEVPTPPAVPQGRNLAWFFKLSGPDEKLTEHLKPFTDLLRSIRFEQGAPRYDLPAGWTVKNGPGMRYQTISIEKTDPPLEVAITSLPAPQEDSLDYLKANIDRWRGQLGMPAMPADDWEQTATSDGQLIRIPHDSLSMTVVNLAGETKDFGETRMLAAVITETPSETANMPSKTETSPAANAPFQYKLPEGWNETEGNAMRLASFGIAGDKPEDNIDISVTRFPGGGGILDNINRWRGQVKLDPITEEQLDKTTEKLEVSGKEAIVAEIKGETTAILVATVLDGDAKWFFKMQGPVTGVSAQVEPFKEFLKSVVFKE